MKMKTSELKGAALDWAVAKAQEMQTHIGYSGNLYAISGGLPTDYKPSEKWSQGGPIIEREQLEISPQYWNVEGWHWVAYVLGVNNLDDNFEQRGPTPLVAAMRCFCCSKLGDEIDIPEELCQQQNS